MKSISVIVFLLLVVAPGLLSAQEDDSTMVNDTTRIAPEDRLTQIQEMMEGKRDTLPADLFFSFNDTLQAFVLPFYENLNDGLQRSFLHDAGDWMKFNPSFFIINYRNTPLRTTLSPFTLPGNRLGVLFNNKVFNPLGHQPEPDNMIDFNDIPTTPVQQAYSLEGPAGMVFGGSEAVASMLLIPHYPDSTRAESRMVADDGWYGYTYTKALFTHRNTRGRMLRAALGYRQTDGASSYTDDDAYHQWYEGRLPLGRKIRLTLEARFYKRSGSLPVIGDSLIADYFARLRKDRDFGGTIDFRHNPRRSSRVTYRHLTNKTGLSGQITDYKREIETEHNSLSYFHDFMLGGAAVQFGLAARQEIYRDRDTDNKRHSGQGELKILQGDRNNAWWLYLKGEHVEGFDPQPTAAAAFYYNSDLFRLGGSVGWSTKFPRQYELDLAPKLHGFFTGASGNDYFEQGNPALKPEKQLTGNLTVGLGRPGNDLKLSVTGGKIFDGIDWQRFDTLSLTYAALRPINHDIEFAAVTAIQNFAWKENLIWSGGGSYRYVKADDNDNLPYTPNYQIFSSLQLYYYIEKLGLHLYGHGEVFYNAVYHGYNNDEYGENIIANFKLSFRIRKFRFYYVFQNLPDVEYDARENFTIPGRFDFYGVTWDFLD